MTSPLSRIVSITSASPEGDGRGPPVCMPVLIGYSPLVTQNVGGPCAAGAPLPGWTGQAAAGVLTADGHAWTRGRPRQREPPAAHERDGVPRLRHLPHRGSRLRRPLHRGSCL